MVFSVISLTLGAFSRMALLTVLPPGCSCITWVTLIIEKQLRLLDSLAGLVLDDLEILVSFAEVDWFLFRNEVFVFHIAFVSVLTLAWDRQVYLDFWHTGPSLFRLQPRFRGLRRVEPLHHDLVLSEFDSQHLINPLGHSRHVDRSLPQVLWVDVDLIILLAWYVPEHIQRNLLPDLVGGPRIEWNIQANQRVVFS